MTLYTWPKRNGMRKAFSMLTVLLSVRCSCTYHMPFDSGKRAIERFTFEKGETRGGGTAPPGQK